MNIDFQTLAVISVLTTLVTECVKILMNKADKNYVSNIIAAIVAVVLSMVVVVIYPMIYAGAELTVQLMFSGLVMAFFGVLTATLGFDKVKQTIDKINGG